MPNQTHHTKQLFIVSLSAIVFLGGLGFAGAQEGGEDAPATTEEKPAEVAPANGAPANGAPASEGDGEVELRRRANLAGSDQVSEAERILQRGNQISRKTSSMLDESRRERDIIRVTCLNDKLTQVNANLRTGEQRIQALKDAVSADDTSRRNHEFTVMNVLGQKFNVLEQEANQCVGQDLFDTGATKVETVVDPATPKEDAIYIDPSPEITVPYVPEPRSPTM